MNDPMISVVMPVYNGEKYLREAIASILNQTYAEFEFIILNDGSIDKTEEIILSYDDPRIVYIKNETNLQIVKTLNKGIKLAKGKYIARMDADDISLPNRFEEQIQFMENNNIDVCGTWVQTFGIRKKIWKYPSLHEEIKINLLISNPSLAHPSVMIRKDVFNHFGYEEQYNKAEDYGLWIRVIEKVKFSNIPLPLLKYRLHSEQTDNRVQKNVDKEIRKVFLKKLGCDFSYHEIETFLEILSNQYVEFSNIELIFNKLLKANRKSYFFDQYLFERLLAIKFLTSWSLNTNHCAQVFCKFNRLALKKIIMFSPIIFIKLLIKCFIGYGRAA